MNTARVWIMTLSALVLALPCLGGKTNLLPGLTYHDGKEKLDGRLVFLASAEALPPTNGLKRCFIYEFDMGRKRLRQIVETPASKHFGGFIAPADGRSYATFYAKDPGRIPVGLQFKEPQWLWLYSEDHQRFHTLSITAAPQG